MVTWDDVSFKSWLNEVRNRSGANDEDKVEIKWWCGTIIDFVGESGLMELY